jgi:hypothetical protein
MGNMTTKNPWLELPEEPDYVLPQDLPYLKAHNRNCPVDYAELKADGIDEPEEIHKATEKNRKYRLRIDVPPAPFSGLHSAPLVVLLANPLYDDRAQKYYAQPNFRKRSLESVTTKGGIPFFTLTDEFRELQDGNKPDWWRQHTQKLAEEIGGYDELSKKLLAIDLHGYHSAKWTAPLYNYPSQEFNFHLVREAMEREAMILVARCQKNWFASIPELRDYENLIPRLNSPRNVSLTKDNMPEGDFGRIVKKLSE